MIREEKLKQLSGRGRDFGLKLETWKIRSRR